MKKLVKLESLVGKTVTAAEKTDDYIIVSTGDEIALIYIDSNFFCDECSCRHDEVITEKDVYHVPDWVLLAAGLITEEENRQRQLEREAENIKRHKEDRRQQYEQLRKEFEPDAVEDQDPS